MQPGLGPGGRDNFLPKAIMSAEDNPVPINILDFCSKIA
jgi:hypothetical protein